jgi:hypothetical protein
MKLSKKREKVTINPKMEQKEFIKKLITELKEKRKKRYDVEKMKDIEKTVEKTVSSNIDDYNKEQGLKEKAPPGREHQVKSLKKKVGTDKAYAFAWAQHNKHGRPDIDEAATFSAAQLDQLKTEYSSLQKIDPSSPTYKKMKDMMGKMSKEQLTQIKDAKIKFLQYTASDLLRKEEVEQVNELSADLLMKASKAAGKKADDALTKDSHFKRGDQSKKFHRVALDKMTKKRLKKDDVDVQEADEMTNTTQHAMSPLEILKTLKDRVEQKNPIAIEGQSWSDFENERLQQLTRMVRPGQNVLMFMDKEESKFDHYALEEYVFVMRDKIPKYEEMGYKIVAE